MLTQTLKNVVKSSFRTVGIEVHKVRSEEPANAVVEKRTYSNLDEQRIIWDYLTELDVREKYCVDIAASDGVTMSNTYSLYEAGYGGLAVECDPGRFRSLAQHFERFPKVTLARCPVTPENVRALLAANETPLDFGFLNLDIDGYDHYVLKALLDSYRPSLICVEINEKIPPPLKFTVKWDPHYEWKTDHFYGQSISKLNELCEQFRYSLVELHYNNAFLIPSELTERPSLSPEQAYREGYLEKPDRQEKFPWNANVETALTLPPEQALAFFTEFFRPYEGQYELSL